MVCQNSNEVYRGAHQFHSANTSTARMAVWISGESSGQRFGSSRISGGTSGVTAQREVFGAERGAEISDSLG